MDIKVKIPTPFVLTEADKRLEDDYQKEMAIQKAEVVELRSVKYFRNEALACKCGSPNWWILATGEIQCLGCKEIKQDISWDNRGITK